MSVRLDVTGIESLYRECARGTGTGPVWALMTLGALRRIVRKSRDVREDVLAVVNGEMPDSATVLVTPYGVTVE